MAECNIIDVNIFHPSKPSAFLSLPCLFQFSLSIPMLMNIYYHYENNKRIDQLPLSKARVLDAVEHKSGGRPGPTTHEGTIVTKSIPFSSQNSHAAFSARTFDRAYHIFCNALIQPHVKKTTN